MFTRTSFSGSRQTFLNRHTKTRLCSALHEMRPADRSHIPHTACGITVSFHSKKTGFSDWKLVYADQSRLSARVAYPRPSTSEPYGHLTPEFFSLRFRNSLRICASNQVLRMALLSVFEPGGNFEKFPLLKVRRED